MARTPSLGTLSKCYAGSLAMVAIGMVGFMAAATPKLDGQQWGMVAFALSLYFVLAGCQFLFLVAFTALRRHFLRAVLGYIVVATALNFMMFGMKDGIRSLIMFVIAAAVVCMVFLLSSGGRALGTR